MIGTLQLDPRITLLTVATAAAACGRDSSGVIELCESGWLRHSFDVSAGAGTRRALRIYRGSLIAFQRKEKDGTPLADVINQVVGVNRPRLRAAELVIAWSITRPHLIALLRTGDLAGATQDHTAWIERVSIVEFLKRRAVGGELPEVGQAAAFDPATLKSFIGRRSPDPGQGPARASRRREPLCMELQEASKKGGSNG